MSDSQRSQSPIISSTSDDDRGHIRSYGNQSTFRVGDRVKVINGDGSRDGPYLIAKVISAGVYILCYPNGAEAQNGDEIEENDLERA